MDMFKAFAKNSKEFFDRDKMINNHRKNLDAMSETSKTAMELLKSVTNMHNQYAKQTFEDLSMMMRDFIKSPLSTENMNKNAERLKETVTKAVDHTSNMANIVVKHNSDFYKKAKMYAEENLDEMKVMFTKKV